MGQSILKRRYIKFGRQGITQKQAYNKVSNSKPLVPILSQINLVHTLILFLEGSYYPPTYTQVFQCGRHSFTPIKNNRYNYSSTHCNLHFYILLAILN